MKIVKTEITLLARIRKLTLSESSLKNIANFAKPTQITKKLDNLGGLNWQILDKKSQA